MSELEANMLDDIHFINNQWLAGTAESLTSYNPATNDILWQGHCASSQQVDLAVQAARHAFPYWSNLSIEKRLEKIHKFEQLLTDNQEFIATTISKETGKPLWESRTEVTAMLGKITISIKAYHQRTGLSENLVNGTKAYIRHKPHGVLAIFGPYNFPGHLPNGHIIPALIAGNTIVFKPSELTPWVAEEIIKLWHAAGLPHGVMNMLQGGILTAQQLSSHHLIDGLLFTGSAATGKKIHQLFAGQPEKILALEMGGNNPLIVHNVNNETAAIHDIIHSAFITAGQRCTCARRLFIEKNKAGDNLLKALLNAIKKIRVGYYDDPNQPFMGPMISSSSAVNMLKAQKQLLSLGANPLILLSHTPEHTGFVTPGIIDVSDVNNSPDEEYFGPLLQVYRYQHFDEAISKANHTRFGLAAGLLADNKLDYDYFYQHIRAGIVNWNKPLTGASSAAPFGGIGASGNHRPSAYYAADYCAYPVASLEAESVSLPSHLAPGLTL